MKEIKEKQYTTQRLRELCYRYSIAFKREKDAEKILRFLEVLDLHQTECAVCHQIDGHLKECKLLDTTNTFTPTAKTPDNEITTGGIIPKEKTLMEALNCEELGQPKENTDWEERYKKIADFLIERPAYNLIKDFISKEKEKSFKQGHQKGYETGTNEINIDWGIDWGIEFDNKFVGEDRHVVKDFICKQKEKSAREEQERIRNEFISEFCNDHNADKDGNGIRWLRGIALDKQDLLNEILNFLNSNDQ